MKKVKRTMRRWWKKAHKRFPASRVVAVLVIVSYLASLHVSSTNAYFNDTELSSGNTYTATTLDMGIPASGSWQVAATAINLFPGDSITRTANIANVGSESFQYVASASFDWGESDAAFCNVLRVAASRNSVPVYSGALTGFQTLSTPSVLATASQDQWDFVVTVPSDAPEVLGDLACTFDVHFYAWQRELTYTEGFSDMEEIADSLFESGGWVVGTDTIKTIDDAYVNEDQPTNNYGTAGNFAVRSRITQNERSFIKFDFHMPSGTVVNSATLKTYLYNAPAFDRTYQLKRADADWDETTINWSNQPTTTSVTDTQATSVSDNIWMNWDVQSDVQNFVAGTYSNYGWAIADMAEDNAVSRTGQFRSSEGAQVAQRPVLEVSFTVPESTTDHMVINEVFSNPNVTQGTDTDNEWIELYNPTDAAIDISGWHVCDSSLCDTFPLGITPIPAKGFAVVAPRASTWNTYWPEILTRGATTVELLSAIGNRLADAGDRVILQNDVGTVIDQVSWGSDVLLAPSVPASGAGYSIARVVKGFDADTAEDWVVNIEPNPGTNPSASGTEIIRFMNGGVIVADAAVGLEKLPGETPDETLVDDPISDEENMPETIASTSFEKLVVEIAEDVKEAVVGSASTEFEEIASPSAEELSGVASESFEPVSVPASTSPDEVMSSGEAPIEETPVTSEEQPASVEEPVSKSTDEIVAEETMQEEEAAPVQNDAESVEFIPEDVPVPTPQEIPVPQQPEPGNSSQPTVENPAPVEAPAPAPVSDAPVAE